MLPDGCYNGIDARRGAPAERVEELRAQCAPSSDPLFDEPRGVTLSAGAATTVPFPVGDPSRCVTVLAAVDGTLSDVEVTVRDPEGNALGVDSMVAPIAIVGPLCTRSGGEHRVELRGDSRSGAAAVQVVRAR